MNDERRVTTRGRLLAYGVGVVAVAITLLIRLLVWKVLGDAVPTMFFIPAVAIAAYYGGLGPGLLSTLLSASIAAYVFVWPRPTLPQMISAPAVSVALFILTGAIISFMSESLHRASRRESIRQQQAAEAEAFRASEQRWRSMTEALPQLVWSALPDGACDYFSTQWTEHTGIAETDLLGWRWLQTLHPEDRERTRQFWLESVAGRHPYDVEYRVRRRDGEFCWFKTRGLPIRDASGQIVKWFGTCTDISDLRRTGEALRRAIAEAKAASRAKDEFLANVSHEIRTPMNAILGMTELALDSDLTDDQRQLLKTVKSAANNLLGIINDLLDFAKIEAGKMELDPADFTLRCAVGDTMRALCARASAKGLQLLHEVSPDVPDALIGDASRLRQVILNLVDNAIKFTDVGKVVVRITSESTPGTDGEALIRFEVQDTGVGIAPEKQERVFLAFEQEDPSTTRKYGGTGLGLTIASRLVALMGGRITVDSVPGLGSTFSFTARFKRQSKSKAECTEESPVSQPQLSDQAIGAVSSRPDSVTSQRLPAAAPISILIAEDNEFNGQLLEQLLTRRGYKVRLATNGREALSIAKNEGFDLLLLDIHMPEMDGFEVAQSIRAHERVNGGHLPVVALTARARKEDRDRCLAAGMDDFLAKPIQAADLWGMIDRVATRPPSDRSHRSLLDPQVILAACGGDAAILEKLRHTFRSRFPDHLKAVHDSLANNNAGQLREDAHKLVGMVAVFSTTVGNVASELEDRAAEGQIDGARLLAAQLEKASGELMQQIDGLSFDALRG